MTLRHGTDRVAPGFSKTICVYRGKMRLGRLAWSFWPASADLFRGSMRQLAPQKSLVGTGPFCYTIALRM